MIGRGHNTNCSEEQNSALIRGAIDHDDEICGSVGSHDECKCTPGTAHDGGTRRTESVRTETSADVGQSLVLLSKGFECRFVLVTAVVGMVLTIHLLLILQTRYEGPGEE